MKLYMDKTAGVPLYRQLAAKLKEDIDSGVYSDGQQLPTESKLAEMADVSKGTVKAAYRELEWAGCVRKVQGSGVYVQLPKEVSIGQQVRPIVEGYFAELSRLGISAAEAYGIFRDEAWKHLHPEEKIRVAWVDCSPELLWTAVHQLEEECSVQSEAFLIQDVVQDPKLLQNKPFDLYATSQMHYEDLVTAMGRDVPVERLALSLENRTVGAIAKLRPGDRVAVIFDSDEFHKRVQDSLTDLAPDNVPIYCSLSQLSTQDKDDFQGCRMILVPPKCEQRDPLVEELETWCQKHKIPMIPFEYLLDEGSLIHLKEKAQSIWTKRATKL